MRVSLALVFAALVLVSAASAYTLEQDDSEPPPESTLDDYSDNNLERLFQNSQKRSSLIRLFRRSCVRKGGSCDHRPNDCCYNSSCRCNLWGANCRCQRAGLFQKWGK
ncbi:U8-agatoxin-Ao1a-like isoform X1 [Neocloeon triangulifer]|uniref:U8-agatoxin-Ao1a-like isoform X1 n=1 Tax=Neocloeon triangulifer TaxID=2078957 RepID=UPI00286F20E3|nr:U8-agatoxin-Ao1a-like isoform X1 [Neocloeon triangulifer]